LKRIVFASFAIVVVALACSKREPPIPACVNAVDEAGKKAEERWLSRAKGKDTPMSKEEAQVMFRCAPLYSDKSCREAHANFDDAPVDRRMQLLVGSCKAAYCPKLAAPKPAICDAKEPSLAELTASWRELDTAILKHEHGDAIQPVLDAKKRANEKVLKAAAVYYDAGAPDFFGDAGPPKDAGGDAK